MKYTAENWKKFGERIAVIRRAAGYHRMSEWVTAVGRSSRVLQGLERGEPVGDGTIVAIAKVVGVDVAELYDILSGPVGGSQQDGTYVASPGAKRVPGVADDEVLRELRAMQQRIEELSRRLENGE